MRRTAPLLLVALAAIMGSGTARAADGGSATAQGRVTAVVVAPVSALALDDLDFGSVAADRPGGEVTVAPMTGETGVS